MIAASISPNGKWAATGSGHPSSPGELVLWDVATGKERWALRFPRGVRAVRFSPDGSRLATGRYDGVIEIYSAPDGESLVTLPAQAAGINALAFTPDGKKIVAAGLDGAATVWDAATGDALLTFRGHTGGRLLTADAAPDGGWVASAGDDAAIRIWDLQTGQPRKELRGHEGYLEQIRFTPDGKSILSIGADGKVRDWDLETGEARVLPSAQTGLAVGLAVSPDGRLATVGRLSGRLEVFDLAAGDGAREVVAHAGGVFGLDFSADGKTLLSASFDGTAKLWGPAADRELKHLRRGFTNRDEPQAIGAAAWSQNGEHVFTGHSDGSIRVTEVQTGRITARVREHDSPIVGLAFARDGKRLRSVDRTGGVKAWDAETPLTDGSRSVGTFRAGGAARLAATAPQGDWLATSGGRDIHLWGLDSEEEVAATKDLPSDVEALAVAPEGRFVAAGGADGKLAIWRIKGDRRRVSESGHDGPIRAVAFSRDGAVVATGGADGSVRLWDVESTTGGSEPGGNASLRSRLTLAGLPGPVTSLLFANESHGLIVAAGLGDVSIWDPLTGTRLDQLKRHSRPVHALALESGTEELVTGDEGGEGLVWERDAVERALRPLAFMPVHRDGARNVMFTPDGTRLVTDGYDNHARVWDLGTGDIEHSFARATSGVRLAADGRLFAVSDWNKGLAVYDLATGSDDYRFSGLDRGADEMAFSPDGRYLLAAAGEAGVKLYDLRSEKDSPAVSLAASDLPTRGLDFATDGATFATVTGDYKRQTEPGVVSIWETGTAQLRKRLSGHSGEVKCVRFSPDGRRLATGGADKRGIVWDVQSGQVALTLAHPATVFAVQFTPSGDLLLTGDFEGAVSIWNAATGELLSREKLHDNFITRLAISPDATVLATASKDGSVKLWPLAGVGTALRIVSASPTVTSASDAAPAWNKKGGSQ